MSGFDINWSLAGRDGGMNALAAFQQGVKIGEDIKMRGALRDLARDPNATAPIESIMQINPEMAFRLSDRQRQNRTNALLGDVFGTPPPAAPQGQPLPADPPTRATMGGDGLAPPSAAPTVAPAGVAAGAPATMVDPSRLPPRTDGVRINQDALRKLYAVDPKTAFQIQNHVYSADAAAFKRMQNNGEVMARAARRLMNVQPGEGEDVMAARQREFQALAPQLVQMGIPAETLGQADLSDAGLSRYFDLGQTIATLTDDDRADRSLDWRMEDDRADNARADRNTDSLVSDRVARRGLTARGQDVASRDRRYSTDRTSSDRRRGQDVTDKRMREGFGSSGGRRGGKAPATLPRIATKAEYDRLPKGSEYINPNGERMRKK